MNLSGTAAKGKDVRTHAKKLVLEAENVEEQQWLALILHHIDHGKSLTDSVRLAELEAYKQKQQEDAP